MVITLVIYRYLFQFIIIFCELFNAVIDTLTKHRLGDVSPFVLRVTAAGKRNKDWSQFSSSAPFYIGALHSASVCGGSDSIRVH